VNRSVDYSALIYPVSRESVAAFTKALKQSGSLWVGTAFAHQAGNAIALAVIVIVGAFQLPGLLGAIGGGDSWTSAIMPLATCAVLVVAAIVVVRRLLSRSTWETWYRLDTFAKANGLWFAPTSAAPAYPGAIFGLGSQQQRYNHMVAVTGRTIDMGNYRYVTKSGKNSRTVSWGYLAIRLDRKLPHMVLDSRANNGIFGSTSLPKMFSKTQALGLEGDFDKYFTLYCPREYERDALYVFTPDLMALLIDEAAPFDVEIIDDWLFVYSPKPFASADPHVYQRLFRIIDTVAAKTLSQTDRYADERIGDPTINLVAPAGQRLKGGIGIGTVIFLGVFAAFWVITTVLGFAR
jgi:hypothetical protein